jgi:hypothetical protein
MDRGRLIDPPAGRRIIAMGLRVWIYPALLAVAALGAASPADAKRTHKDAHVVGRVRECKPVPPGTVVPLSSGQVIAYSRRDRRVATAVVKNGRFVVHLPPGFYTIAVAHYPRQLAEWQGVVAPHATTHVQIVISGCK